MKRLIKFRGKRTDTGEWVFGNLVMIRNGDAGKYYPCIVISYNHDTFDWIEVIPDTVGQFTGLLDKNGKEIYNGDILSSNGKIIGYVIDGVRGYCYDVVYTPPLANGETSWSLYGVVVNDHPNEIEVSGNVFDNPELLKGGSNV